MNNRLIIGFSGPKGSGKDSGYRLLTELFPRLNFQRLAFADPIKNTICNLFGLTVNQLNTIKRLDTVELLGSDDNRYGLVTGRDFVRNIGMLMRSYDDQQFNRYVVDNIKNNPTTNYVITDVRFENELQAIRSVGGIIINIVRPGVTYDHHVTETELSDYDFQIINDSFDDYRRQLVTIIERIFEQRLR